MKENLLKALALVMCAILVVFAFAACGGKTETPTEKAAAADSEKADDAGKATAGAIVGSWEYVDGGYTYTFNKDGTGNYKAGETVMEFTYEDLGDKVSILYTGNTVASEYAYTISGDTLSIEDSFGEKVEYVKK